MRWTARCVCYTMYTRAPQHGSDMAEHMIFDCDQHMYETRDTFTRHLPEEFQKLAVTPVTLANGKEVILAGDKVIVAMEPEFGEAYKPGSLKEMLKEMATGAPP